MPPFNDQLFHIWFPAIVGGLFIGLLVACLWDVLRRRIRNFASMFWPGVLEEVGLIHNRLPRTGISVEGRPNIIVLEVEQLENSFLACKLRPDLLSEAIQSRSPLENGANPFRHPEELQSLLLQAHMNQESSSALKSDNLTESRDQHGVHPRHSAMLGPRTSEDASQLPHSETNLCQDDQLLDARGNMARVQGERFNEILQWQKPRPRSSIHYGVRYRPDLRRFVAEIRVAEWKQVDKKLWLGTFNTEEDAARGVDVARKLLNCRKKHPLNIPCPELDLYSTKIPPHLDLTDITNQAMFKDVMMFIRNECRAYVDSFSTDKTLPIPSKNTPNQNVEIASGLRIRGSSSTE